MTPRLKRFIQNSLLAIGSLAALYILLFLADRAIGRFSPPSIVDGGLLFVPYSAAHYDTIEFECRVRINNLGFRGEDTTVKKSRKFRVVALGDSFTYGWGVNLDDTWVKRLEAALIADGYDIEVLNLAVPGFGPAEYADTAEKVIPILKPDLVLVGVVQGNDLEQLDHSYSGLRQKSVVAETIRLDELPPAAASIVDHLLPNLSRVMTRAARGVFHRSGPEIAINEVWQRQTRAYLDAMNESQREKFDQISDFLRRSLLQGRLNPAHLTWLVPWPSAEEQQALTDPEAQPRSERPDPSIASTQPDAPAADSKTPTQESPAVHVRDSALYDLELDSDQMQLRIERCAKELNRIRVVAETHGATVCALTIPATHFVQTSGWDLMIDPVLSDDTRRARESRFTSPIPDQAIERACAAAGVPVESVTADFRERGIGQRRFYDFDAHLNVTGNELYAKLIAPRVELHLR